LVSISWFSCSVILCQFLYRLGRLKVIKVLCRVGQRKYCVRFFAINPFECSFSPNQKKLNTSCSVSPFFSTSLLLPLHSALHSTSRFLLHVLFLPSSQCRSLRFTPHATPRHVFSPLHDARMDFLSSMWRSVGVSL